MRSRLQPAAAHDGERTGYREGDDHHDGEPCPHRPAEAFRYQPRERHQQRYLTALTGLEYWRRRIENFAETVKAVFEALDAVVRASSAVECLNSILRPYVSVKKRMSQRFLALIALYWDMHPLPNRNGRTPFEEKGVSLGTDDWVEALELEMARMRLAKSHPA